MNTETLKTIILEILSETEAEAHIPDEPEEDSEFEEKEFGVNLSDHGLKEYGGIQISFIEDIKTP